MQIEVNNMGVLPMFLTVSKWGHVLTCAPKTPHGPRVMVDLRKVKRVVGHLCEVEIVRTSGAALAVASWLATHGVDAGIAYSRTDDWFQVVVADKDLVLALSLFAGLDTNVLTGEITQTVERVSQEWLRRRNMARRWH